MQLYQVVKKKKKIGVTKASEALKLSNSYQTHFEYVCELNKSNKDNGKILFRYACFLFLLPLIWVSRTPLFFSSLLGIFYINTNVL